MASQIKPDPDASIAYIKADPDSKDAAIDEDDIYEDAGDLDFSNAAQSLWLSRIPRSLWEHWSKLDEDEEIELGTVRIEGDPNDIKRVRFFPLLLPDLYSDANGLGATGQLAPPPTRRQPGYSQRLYLAAPDSEHGSGDPFDIKHIPFH